MGPPGNIKSVSGGLRAVSRGLIGPPGGSLRGIKNLGNNIRKS